MAAPDPALVALDSSVLVAGLSPWHEQFARARPVLATLAATTPADRRFVLPVPALVESYSVLTRLPAPLRVSPAKALSALHQVLHGRVQLVNLAAEETWEFLTLQRDSRVLGGRVYDALILACAAKAGAGILLTFNVRHFASLSSTVTIREP